MAPGDARPVWLIDLDGVVWLGDEPIAGAADAVGELRADGVRVAFFTNNSFATQAHMLDKFARHGIEVPREDLLSSSQAAAHLLDPGARATALGGDGIVEALVERGVEHIPLLELGTATVDAVLVGLDYNLTFDRLAAACRAIANGARFIATNDDSTYPTPTGVLPGGGALVAAVATTTKVTPTVAGKPNPPAVALVEARLGAVDVVVGDRPETDGALARALGTAFALVRSGVTPPGAAVDVSPDVDAPDLAHVVPLLRGASSRLS